MKRHLPCMRSLWILTLLLLFPAAPARGNITLNSWSDVSGYANYTDVKGWVDPLTGIEYALIGNSATALHIVDVSDPYDPVEVAQVTDAARFDVKTWGSYAYVVDGNYGLAGLKGSIIDLHNPASPIILRSIPAAHNIFIDDQGFMFLSFPGVKCFDLRASPTNPQFLWEVPTLEGHDVTVVGDRLYDFHGNLATFIWDISDRTRPIILGAIYDPTIVFYHQGWPSADGNFLFIADEMNAHPVDDITVWDISDPGAAFKVGGVAVPDATVHNLYVIGNYMYVAYYTAGFHVYDVTVPASPVLVDSYDTTVATGEGKFEGAWGCDPFLPSGNILISDRPSGLFVFSFTSPTTGVRGHLDLKIRLEPSHPNPFNPSTTIPFTLARGGRVTLDVYDAGGRLVRRLLSAERSAGPHQMEWNGRDENGNPVASGVYFARLAALGATRVIKMTLIK